MKFVCKFFLPPSETRARRRRGPRPRRERRSQRPPNRHRAGYVSCSLCVSAGHDTWPHHTTFSPGHLGSCISFKNNLHVLRFCHAVASSTNNNTNLTNNTTTTATNNHFVTKHGFHVAQQLVPHITERTDNVVPPLSVYHRAFLSSSLLHQSY